MNITRSCICSLMIVVAFLPAFGPVPLQAAGKTHSVATNDDDRNDGTTRNNPFKRIRTAADVMQPGYTCLTRGGEYRERKVVPRPFAKLATGRTSFRFAAGSTASASVTTNSEGN